MVKLNHPQTPPAMPWYRGASDLSGVYGDLFYGTTQRSKNVYVKDATTTATRRGLERAFDAQYEGNAEIATRRSGSSRYVLLGDGSGVTALSSLAASKYPGLTADHSGFVNDYFIRADSGSLSAAQRFWIEGQDSIQTPADTAADTTNLASNTCRFNQSVGNSGSIDWSVEAPSLYSFCGWEFDFGSLVTSAVDDMVDIYVFQNMPGEFVHEVTREILKERMYAVDGFNTFVRTFPGVSGSDNCWSGLVAHIRVKRERTSGDPYRVQLDLSEFMSSLPPNDRQNTPYGSVDTVRSKVISSLYSTASVETKWLLNLGRVQETDGWGARASLWQGVGNFAYNEGNLLRSTADADLNFTGISLGTGHDGFFRSLPPGGGFSGAFVKFSGATGTVGINSVDTSLGDNANG